MTTRKTRPPNPATATSASNVVPLRESVPVIEPDEGWTKTTTEGEHLAAEHGEGDRRLVQLSTVFRGVVDRSDAPPSVVLEQALALVADIPTGALYLVQKDGWPATFTEGQALPGFGSAGYVDLDAPPPPPYGHGIGALVALMGAVWVTEQKGQISTGPGWWLDELPGAHEYLCRFAVSLPVAHSLWGWGKVTAPAVDAVVIPATWAQLVAWPGRKEPGFVWADNLRQIVASEKRRRSDLAHTGITAALGAELGCSARHINDLIGGIGKPGSRQQVLRHAVACLGNGTSGKDSR